jgi:hypothetical protein
MPEEVVDGAEKPAAGSEEAAAAAAAAEAVAAKENEIPVQTIEDIARELNWRPLEEYRGDPDKWVDAATFLKNGVVVQQKLQRNVKQLEASIGDLKLHNERVYKVQVHKLQDEIKQLKEERKAAIADGNVALVEQLDDKIEATKEAIPEKPAETAAADTEVNEKFNAWVSQNQWYTKHPEMKKYADKVGEKYAGAPIERILTKVEEAVKDVWPEHFENKKREARPAADTVEGSGRRPSNGGKKTTYTWNDLSEDARRTGDRFARQGIMTREQYLKERIEMGDLE